MFNSVMPDRPIPSYVSRASSMAEDRHIKAELQAKYVKELWFFLTAVIALLACFRAARYLAGLVVKPSLVQLSKDKNDPESIRSNNGRISIRRVPAAFAAGFRIVAFRWTVPIGPRSVASVSELVFIIGYILAIFIWLLVDTRDLQTMFYEDRAAHFASSQLPLIVSLAGKNNIISFLTGIGHEKLNVLHRAAARTCLILIWMHAIARTSSGLPEIFDFTHPWMMSGATSLTAFSLATLLSIRPVRQMAFEFFLVSHIILVAAFLICGYFHARDPGFGVYIWPGLVIWAFDRVLRVSRLLWNNRIWSAKNEHSIATVELISQDTVRLTLRRQFTWTPGQHAYVILPSVSTLPTEAHPFTIASIPKKLEGTDDKEVVFLIRGRSGFTRRLKDFASRNSEGSNTVPAFLDGPYGCPPNLNTFTTCVLIAGGSGVSYTLPLLLDIIEKARGGKSAVRRVVFVWAVRAGDHLTWISKALTNALASVPPSLTLEPRVYITGSASYQIPIVESDKFTPPPTPSSSGALSIQEQTSDVELPVYSALKLTQGRPSIRKLLHDEITTSPGPVSVDVAGPSALSQSVRRELRRAELVSPIGVLKGLPTVELHVETFGMVKS